MSNSKFVNKLLTLAMLIICNSVVNASGNMNCINDGNIMNNSKQTITGNDSPKSDNSTKSSSSDKVKVINLYSVNNNSETDNKNKIVPYEPDKMWFDYQALFDNAKNAILGYENMKSIGKTDFEKNKFVRHVLFGNNGEHYKNDLKMISNGCLSAYVKALYNMLEYEKTGVCVDYNDDVPDDDKYDLIHLNYQYMLGIVASFYNDYWEWRSLFRQEAGCFPDDYINYSNINNVNYNQVMQYIFE